MPPARKYLPWTPAEDARLREVWPDGGTPAALAALPDRTQSGIYGRVRALGILRQPPWTAAQDKLLAWHWGSRRLPGLAEMLGRSPNAVARRAHELGLPTKKIPGHETLRDAAKRLGFSRTGLRSLLAYAGVYMTPAATVARKATRRRTIDQLDADAAVARWMASENLTHAAEARGVDPKVLKRWMREAGYKPPRTHGHWRLPTADIDAVVAARRPRRSEAAE